ncbi:MAG: GxxExxY protein [Chitinophagales bacterium]
MITKKYLDELTYEIIGAAIEVHKAIGPGLLESVYHKCMVHELELRGINFQSEQYIELNYKGLNVAADLRCDLLVENAIVVELKSAKEIDPIHEAILLTYMKLLEKPKGLMINFNVTNIFSEGQKTYVNEFFRDLPDH